MSDNEKRCICGCLRECHNNDNFCYHHGECRKFSVVKQSVDISKIEREEQMEVEQQ